MIIGIEASHANKKKRSGVEEYSWQIIQHLKKIIPPEINVVLYSQTPLLPLLNDLPENWESKVLKWPQKFKLWSQIRLSFELWKNPPDVFFAPGQLVPIICPKNTVTTVHDSAFRVYPKIYRFFGRQYLRIMNWLIIKKSSKIITPSQFNRQELNRLYGFDINNVVVVEHGYNNSQYIKINIEEEKRRDFLIKYKVAKPFLLFVGRLEEKKNVSSIIKAYNIIKKSTDLQLVLIGSAGCGFDDIEKTINESSYKKDIICQSWITDNDLAIFYNLAKVFVFPSKYEGFGLPVLEAMACGCPVVISKNNSLEEVGGDAVLYASAESVDEIAEAVIKLLNDKDLYLDKVEKGLKRVIRYSWIGAADKTFKILSSIAKRGKLE